MALEFGKRMKALDEYTKVLKHELLFSMAEHKLEPDNSDIHKIITIKQELDRVAQEKMRLSQIYYGNMNKDIALTVPTG